MAVTSLLVHGAGRLALELNYGQVRVTVRVRLEVGLR